MIAVKWADPVSTNRIHKGREEAFAVQRLIVAQIDGQPDNIGGSGPVDTSNAPWFDWGPYLWADGPKQRTFDGLNWCNGQGPPTACGLDQLDLRYGDGPPQIYWGDFTHPTALGAQKAAMQMVTFFTKTTANGGSPFVQHWNQQ